MIVALALGCLVLPAAWPTAARAQSVPDPGGGLMEKVVPQNVCPAPGPAAGQTPLRMSSYSIDYDEGGFTAISRKTVGTLTELTFAAVRWAVSVGSWLVSWAFSFGLADRLARPMAVVAGRYQEAFYAPQIGAALLASAAYAGLQIFRGRTGRGVAEFGASLLLVGILATWLLSDPKAFLDTSLRVTANLAGSVASVGLGNSASPCARTPGSFASPGIDAAVAPLTAELQRSFVQQPYELLQWGTLVPPNCRAARDAVLAASPGGNRNTVVSVMDQPGCTALYRFNRDPSTERLGVAVVVLIASGLMMLSLATVAGTVVAAQVVVVMLIALLPFAALSAALPGGGRTASWRWATALVRALTTIVVMSGFLTFLLLASDALLSAGQDQPLMVQMASLNVVAILAFALRQRMVRAGRLASTHVVRRLEASQPALRAPRTAVDVLGFVGSASPHYRVSTQRLGGDDLAGRVASAVGRARAPGIAPSATFSQGSH
ncbi:MAG: hypothetical protein NVSMB32_02770 [Actinomycetota bacterium]